MKRVILLCILLVGCALSQNPCQLPWPKDYIVYELGTNDRITVDGKLDEPAWTEVAWTDPFQDIQGPSQPKPRFDTYAKMRWDEEYLYIGAYIQDPQIWANQTEHDSVIFFDNDFEVFTDPNWSNSFYKEFEMNALNTTWDLYLNKPYLDGGSPTNNWDIVPILTGVFVEGEINNPAVVDKYWTVEIAFPFKSLAYLQTNITVPPQPKDQWRINFSRVEYHVTVVDGRFEKVPNVPEDNWVWSPQEVINMHIPERWGIIQFSADPINTTTYIPDPSYIGPYVQCFYKYIMLKRSLHLYYTPVLADLGLSPYIMQGKCDVSVPVITPNDNPAIHSFQVTATDSTGTIGCIFTSPDYINDSRLLWLQIPAE